ncbi:MAG: chromosomal replication initiator protein DnaA [Planctomycetota bacterium]
MDPAVAEKVCTIRQNVADRIGHNRFRTWFGGDAEFQLDGRRLHVIVGNAFVGHWISTNFMPHLVEAAQTVIGDEPQIEIRVGPRAAASETLALPPATTDLPAPPPRPAVVAGPRRAPQRPTLRGELETFVVGPSNELAFSVARAAVERPGAVFKHLVVHGGCGLGKTHLLQGVCNGLTRAHPALQWCFLSGEEFTNEFIYAVKAGRVDAFRSRFRNVDVLVLDDIHFLANKKATQEEFLHTFNSIDASGQMVVLSSDRHPRSIATLSEPLVSRLTAAMVVRIDPPEWGTRREILRRRAAAMACPLPDDVLDFLARHITRNVRELEGALYKLSAYAALTREPIRLDMAQRAVEDYITTPQMPEAADIERMVAAHFGVTRDALHSSSRDRTVTHARGFAMYLIRMHTRMSFPEIGRALGHRQHSSVLMAVRRIQGLLDRDGAVTWRTPAGMREVSARQLLEEFERRLRHGPDPS